MPDQTLGCHSAWALCALVAAGTAQAQSAAPDAPVHTLRAGPRIDRMLIADPHARISDASRLNHDLASKDGHIPPPTPGYTITSTVLAKAGSPAGRPALLAPLNGGPIDGLPGWWKIELPTIAEAISLADTLADSTEFTHAFVDIARPIALRTPNDPGFALQWHLRNAESPGIDSGATHAWNAGFTGSGILVGVIEGQWQTDHPDIIQNHNAAASKVSGTPTNHATSVAGLIAASRNNAIGGSGIIPDARVSSLVHGTALQNAEAFAWRNDIHHIKNNSWGPIDNGTLGQITDIERDALIATTTGRNGLGTILVWAAGNGAAASDRVEYDPYASSRYAIAVGAIDDDDDKAFYSEPGASLLVVAHSSGGPGPGDRQIYTTKAGSGYTITFGGTSAAAPIISGIVGMMLQANPNMTWRDVQQALIHAARICDPSSPTWTTNGVGRRISYAYGFGAVRAMDAVAVATSWHPLPPEHVAASPRLTVNAPIPDGNATGISRTLRVTGSAVIETVELTLNVTSTYVGDLNIALRSPAGTESILALTRNDPTDHLISRSFTSRRHNGERAEGDWVVTISDPVAGDPAFWIDARLIAYGHCPSDVNADGITDILDLLDFIDSFGPCVGARAPCAEFGPGPADYNRDEVIDILDLLDMIEDYSYGC